MMQQLFEVEWSYEPGDSGDPSVGMGPTAPSIYVELETDDGLQTIQLAEVFTPAYAVRVPHCTPECPLDRDYGYCLLTGPDGSPLHNEYDDGTRYVGDENAIGAAMAAAPDLIGALKDALADKDGWRERAESLLLRLAHEP